MNFVVRTIRGMLGLFVDDGTLALTLIVVLLAVGILLRSGAIGRVLAIVLLVTGAVGALLVNVIRAAAKRSDTTG